jgi:acyl-CoA synthetase (AMP-forming)/AMP-acid ligase II
MTKTANANVAPAEVEIEMQALPGVASAYVIDVPDARRGSVVAAAVVAADGTTPDPEALIEALSERLINRPGPAWPGWTRVIPLRWAGAGPVFPMCEDRNNTRARACPGYAPGRGLSQ